MRPRFFSQKVQLPTIYLHQLAFESGDMGSRQQVQSRSVPASVISVCSGPRARLSAPRLTDRCGHSTWGDAVCSHFTDDEQLLGRLALGDTERHAEKLHREASARRGLDKQRQRSGREHREPAVLLQSRPAGSTVQLPPAPPPGFLP